MAEQSPFVRITIEQLAALIRQLSLRDVDPMLMGITPVKPDTLAIGTSSNVQLLPANSSRWAIIMSAGGGQISSVWFGATAVAPAGSWIIASTVMPLVLTYREIGAAITKEVMATGLNVGSSISWQEFETPIDLG